MKALNSALGYAARGRRVFPCREKGSPRVLWREKATMEEQQIEEWWSRHPQDLIGTPTGEQDVVLDVDPPRGLDSLAELGFPFWFETATSHTPRGGVHAHFSIPPGNIRNTAGARGCGIGVNLDWRGHGGYVVLPSPDSGYWWDPICNIDFPLAEVPPALLPREAKKPLNSRPARPITGLSPYGEGALKKACLAILHAVAGEQEATLNRECFSIGTLAGAGSIPADFARRELLWAAGQIPDYDPKRPWRAGTIERHVNRSFDAGLKHPR